MQLTLVRHGEAAPPINGVDSKRPLTERGHKQAQQTADFFKKCSARCICCQYFAASTGDFSAYSTVL